VGDLDRQTDSKASRHLLAGQCSLEFLFDPPAACREWMALGPRSAFVFCLRQNSLSATDMRFADLRSHGFSRPTRAPINPAFTLCPNLFQTIERLSETWAGMGHTCGLPGAPDVWIEGKDVHSHIAEPQDLFIGNCRDPNLYNLSRGLSTAR